MKIAKRVTLLAFVAVTLSSPTLAAGFVKYDGVEGESNRQTQAQPAPQQDNMPKGNARSVTYGPVITIKPKGHHAAEANCEKGLQKADGATPQGANPASQRDKCFTNH